MFCPHTLILQQKYVFMVDFVHNNTIEGYFHWNDIFEYY